MAGNTPMSGFSVLPQFQGNMYDLQTKQALAQALIQKGLQGDLQNYQPAGGGFAYVPKYGAGAIAAQLGNALLGNQLQQEAGQGLANLGAQQWAALTGEGLPQTQGVPSGQQLGAALGGNSGQSGAAPMTAAGGVQAQTARPAPLQPGGVLNPAGIPTTLAYQGYTTNPEKYWEMQAAQYKPAEIVTQLRAAGIDPNSALGQQIAQQSIAKNINIAPLAGGPGTTYRSATNPTQVLASNPMIETGQEVLGYTPEGRPIIANMIGAESAMGGLARAKALGTASAEPIAGVDVNGRPVFGNKAQAAQGQPMGGATLATGRFAGYQAPGAGSELRPGLSAAEQSSAGKMGEQNQAAYSGLQSQASGAADRSNMLSTIEGYARGTTNFGPGWEKKLDVLADINSKLPNGWQLGGDSAANAQIVQKYASNLIQNYQKTMGGSGSDKQMEMVMHGTPGSEMYNKAILEVTPKLRAMEAALGAKSDAADAWVAQHGNSTANFNQFETQWRQAYDPRVFQMVTLQSDPAAVKTFLSHIPDAEVKVMMQKYRTLKQNGWLK